LLFIPRPEHSSLKDKVKSSRPRPENPKAKAKKFGLKAKAKD